MNIKTNRASKIVNLILPKNYNKDGIIQKNDQQNVSNNLKSTNKNNDVQKWVKSISLYINDDTEVVFSNQDKVDDHLTESYMTCVRECIVINIPTEIYNNKLSTNNKSQNYQENCNIINNDVISEMNMCTNDHNIINEANSINNNYHTIEVELLEEANHYDISQIGASAYRKLSRGNKRKINATLRLNGKSYKTRKGTVVKEK
jgi:hypothetical protein